LKIASQTPPSSHAYNIGENFNIFDASKFMQAPCIEICTMEGSFAYNPKHDLECL
jgi:hypothetical protein